MKPNKVSSSFKVCSFPLPGRSNIFLLMRAKQYITFCIIGLYSLHYNVVHILYKVSISAHYICIHSSVFLSFFLSSIQEFVYMVSQVYFINKRKKNMYTYMVVWLLVYSYMLKPFLPIYPISLSHSKMWGLTRLE